MWQDYVIAIVSFLFSVILLPQLKDVYHGQSLNLYSGAFTTIGLYIISATFITMGYWVSFVADLIAGTMWFLIFLFSLKNIRKKTSTK